MKGRNYRLHFVSGELSGRSFVLPPEGLLIGKSRAAAIRPGTSDIRIEHAALSLRDDRVLLESRAETVFVNTEQLEPGATRAIDIGDDVRLGADLSFVVEADEGLPADASLGDEETADELTEDDAAASPAGERHTRYASELELAELRSFVRRQTRRKKLFLAGSVIVLLFVVIGGFLYTELYQENPVTWPGELNNRFNEGEFRIELKPAGKFMIYYPQCGMTRKQTNGNCCEIMTLLGKNLDVPFHLRLTVNTLPDGFVTSRKASFKRWRVMAAEKQGFSFQSLPEDKFYAADASGYPYYSINCKRTDGNLQWQGKVSYLRYHDQEIIFLKEVPLRHFWRTEKVLERFNCFVVSPDAVNSSWEIPGALPKDISRTNFYKALLEHMRGSLVDCDWQELKERFAVLLSSAGHNKDTGMMLDALELWREFRERQQIWYCRECLAYQMYDSRGDIAKKQEIVTECLRKFPKPDDYRHIKITENIWTIDL